MPEPLFFFPGGPGLGHRCYGARPPVPVGLRGCGLRGVPHDPERVAIHHGGDQPNRRRLLKDCSRGEIRGKHFHVKKLKEKQSIINTRLVKEIKSYVLTIMYLSRNTILSA